MRFLTRSFLALLMAAATLGLLAWAAQITLAAVDERRARDVGGPPPRERVFAVDVAAAAPGPETPVLTAFGEVRARRALELRTPGSGRVVELAEGFEEGGPVTAGDVLLRLDPADAETDLAVARADLTGAEAERRDAERGLELAQAELAGAQSQRDLQAQAVRRQRDLSDRGVGAAAAVETAELALSAAEQTILARRGAIAQAEARVDAAGLGVDRARIALARAERALADRTLTAPFTGTLSEVDVLPGAILAPNERIATLIDPSGLEVAFRLSTAQHARLLDGAGDLTGAPVRVLLDVAGLDLAAEGVVTREAPAVAEGQTGRLVFAGLDRAPGFRPGDFVRVRVREPELSDAIRLPATALGPQGTLLLVGAEDRLEEAEVQLLRRQGDDVLVRAADVPLAGRRVVVSRGPALGAGIKVRPRDPAPTTGATAMVEGDGARGGGPERVALDPERRARLIAFVEGGRMPDDVKARLLAQLREEMVPAATIARLERRMGG